MKGKDLLIAPQRLCFYDRYAVAPEVVGSVLFKGDLPDNLAKPDNFQ